MVIHMEMKCSFWHFSAFPSIIHTPSSSSWTPSSITFPILLNTCNLFILKVDVRRRRDRPSFGCLQLSITCGMFFGNKEEHNFFHDANSVQQNRMQCLTKCQINQEEENLLLLNYYSCAFIVIDAALPRRNWLSLINITLEHNLFLNPFIYLPCMSCICIAICILKMIPNLSSKIVKLCVVIILGKYKTDSTQWRYVHVDDMRELGRYIHVHIPYNGGYGPYTHVPNPYMHFEPKFEESNPVGSYRYLQDTISLPCPFFTHSLPSIHPPSKFICYFHIPFSIIFIANQPIGNSLR